MQVSCRRLYMPVLTARLSAASTPHRWKFVVSLGVVKPLLVNPQIPFAVFGKTVEADIFAFLPGRRLMFAPGIALVEFKSSSSEKRFGMFDQASRPLTSPVEVAGVARVGISSSRQDSMIDALTGIFELVLVNSAQRSATRVASDC